MQIGNITIDGMNVGVIEINLSEEVDHDAGVDYQAYAPTGKPTDDEDLSGGSRLGHQKGFFPGSEKEEHHRGRPEHIGKEGHLGGHGYPHAPHPVEDKEKRSTRLGHQHGFHPATGDHKPATPDGSGAPSAILDQAREVALHGGPGAVSRYMAAQGYPKDSNWCGEFAASVVHGAGGTPPKGAPIASNWRQWGTATATPVPGDIAVRRGTPTGQTGSHVTIVEDYNPKTGVFTGLGGNQGAWERQLPAGQYEFRHGDTAPAAPAPAATPGGGNTVRGSYFTDPSTASGLSAAEHPGIALPSRAGLGKMYEVTGPNGQTAILPQIDVGPAKWTGRGIDISGPAAKRLGLSASGNFPTDAKFTYKLHEPNKPIDISKEPM
jgi:hypothetical protein